MQTKTGGRPSRHFSRRNDTLLIYWTAVQRWHERAIISVLLYVCGLCYWRASKCRRGQQAPGHRIGFTKSHYGLHFLFFAVLLRLTVDLLATVQHWTSVAGARRSGKTTVYDICRHANAFPFCSPRGHLLTYDSPMSIEPTTPADDSRRNNSWTAPLYGAEWRRFSVAVWRPASASLSLHPINQTVMIGSDHQVWSSERAAIVLYGRLITDTIETNISTARRRKKTFEARMRSSRSSKRHSPMYAAPRAHFMADDLLCINSKF